MTTATFSPGNSLSAFLPIEFTLPKDEELARDLIMRREQQTATILNIKENGTYDTAERLSAQQWFSTSSGINKPRYGFRKVVNFGGLPNAGTTSVAHGITIDANTIFTRIYATASDPTGNYIPIPYASSTANKNIEIKVDATNVTIITGIDRTAFTICYVVLEYIKF